MANMNVLDVLKQNDNDPVVGMIEENMSAHPEFQLAARGVENVNFKSLVRTAFGAAGFRDVNEGVATSKATYEQRLSSLALCDASSEVDKQMAQLSDDPIETLLANEMDAKIENYMRVLATQFYYGRKSTVGVSSSAASAAKGFPGLVDLYDTSNMEVDAGGSSGAYTSLWVVKDGPKYLQWLTGTGGLWDVGEVTEERLTDGSSNPYDGLRQAVTFWIGLHGVNPRNMAVRVKKVDTSATLTDAMINEALTKFPIGIAPTAIIMTRRSALQLQGSRTATSPSGKDADWVTGIPHLNGQVIPVWLTDAISEAETS